MFSGQDSTRVPGPPFPNPDLNGANPLGPGAPGTEKEGSSGGSGLTCLRHWGRRQPVSGLVSPREGELRPCYWGATTRRKMDAPPITRHTLTRKYPPLNGAHRPLFPLLPKPNLTWRGDNLDKLEVKSTLHVYRPSATCIRLRGLVTFSSPLLAPR